MPEAIRWNPADYAEHSQGQERWAKDLLDLLRLQKNEGVLDIGCGDGRVTAEIAARVSPGEVVGIDSSPEMVAFASARFQLPNLRFLQADARALPFESQFDVVYSSAVLHWVKEHRPVLYGIAHSLRPGGRCLLQMGGRGNVAAVTDAFERCLRSGRWPGADANFVFPYGFYGPEEYREWLKEAGLAIDDVELVEKNIIHADRSKFTGWLRTAWLPFANRVSEACRREFLEAVTDEYLAENPCSRNGEVHVRAIRLQVQAHKPM